MHSCGGCQHFTKMPLEGDSGLCEFHDSRAKVDWGHPCTDFKPLKYNRLHAKREAQAEIKAAE